MIRVGGVVGICASTDREIETQFRRALESAQAIGGFTIRLGETEPARLVRDLSQMPPDLMRTIVARLQSGSGVNVDFDTQHRPPADVVEAFGADKMAPTSPRSLFLHLDSNKCTG
jgi:hypothetical protein